MPGTLGADQNWAARLKAALAPKVALEVADEPADSVAEPSLDPPSLDPQGMAMPQLGRIQLARVALPSPASGAGLLAALGLAPLVQPPSPDAVTPTAPTFLLALLQPEEAKGPSPALEGAGAEAAPPAIPPAPAPAIKSAEPGAEAAESAPPPAAPAQAVEPPAPMLEMAQQAASPATAPGASTAEAASSPGDAESLPIAEKAAAAPKPAGPELGFVPAAFADAYAELMGAPPGPKELAIIRARQGEWFALLRSITQAEGEWHALAFGARAADPIMSAGLAAKRRGLRPRMQLLEPDPATFKTIQGAFAAQDFSAARIRMRRMTVSATPHAAAPNVVAAERLFAEMPRCDYLHVDLDGLIVPLLSAQLAELTGKVRWLVLTTRNRFEEHQAFTLLGLRGWQLMAEHSCQIDRRAPPRPGRPGLQVWRNPFA